MGLDGLGRSMSAAAKRQPARHWAGRMIAPLSDAGVGTQSSFVAREFEMGQGGPAILHISAQGLYRAFVNGARVGKDLLTPGWTCYDDRIAYQSYDVSTLLKTGQNRLEIWLGDGWFRSQMMWAEALILNCWGDRIAAIAEIVAGDAVVVASDAQWRSGLLPEMKSGIYYGEDYDARVMPVETHGVEEIGFDTGLLVPHETAPVRELPSIAPVDSWTDAEGRMVWDFGQNAGAYLRFTATGTAGAILRLEHAEVLGPDRFFDNSNYRSARSEVVYTLKGGSQTYAPFFTF